MAKKTKATSRRGRRPTDRSALLAKLQAIGLFTRQDATKMGLPAAALSRLARRGEIEQVGRNLFMHPQAAIDAEAVDFAAACDLLGPEAAIGGLSALFHHRLIDEAPSRIWVLVSPGQRTRQQRYRLLRTTIPLDVEIETRSHYRIATLERSVVEAFKHERIWGLETAFAAAKAAIDTRQTTSAKLLASARELGLDSAILKHWEVLLAFEGPSS